MVFIFLTYFTLYNGLDSLPAEPQGKPRIPIVARILIA